MLSTRFCSVLLPPSTCSWTSSDHSLIFWSCCFSESSGDCDVITRKASLNSSTLTVLMGALTLTGGSVTPTGLPAVFTPGDTESEGPTESGTVSSTQVSSGLCSSPFASLLACCFLRACSACHSSCIKASCRFKCASCLSHIAASSLPLLAWYSTSCTTWSGIAWSVAATASRLRVLEMTKARDRMRSDTGTFWFRLRSSHWSSSCWYCVMDSPVALMPRAAHASFNSESDRFDAPPSSIMTLSSLVTDRKCVRN
mmetsp:Transcript_36329/g.82848  ORF Transcript_36329/g.82848 Transcript_36329/m.82848 type:complete len:255 (-) Transcript_36329:1096-1860(-)